MAREGGAAASTVFSSTYVVNWMLPRLDRALLL